MGKKTALDTIWRPNVVLAASPTDTYEVVMTALREMMVWAA